MVLRCKTLVILFAALFFVFSVYALAVADDQRDDTLILFDMLIARPASLGVTLMGTALFVVWLPFSLPSKTVKDAGKKLVVNPVNFTFKRPLGQF